MKTMVEAISEAKKLAQKNGVAAYAIAWEYSRGWQVSDKKPSLRPIQHRGAVIEVDSNGNTFHV